MMIKYFMGAKLYVLAARFVGPTVDQYHGQPTYGSCLRRTTMKITLQTVREVLRETFSDVIISNLPFLGFVSFLASPVYLAFILMRDGLPFLNGQSPGKSAMKIKAVTTDGQSLAGNWQPALVRNAVLLIPLFGLVELVVLLTREDKPEQGIRLGDEWGKTRVVFANPPEALEEDEASA